MTTKRTSKYGALKIGETRAGAVFSGYRPDGSEHWSSPEAYHRWRIIAAVKNARTRSAKAQSPFDIDVAYMVGIYPPDARCPALGILLSWGDDAGRSSSPSIDKIQPELGYVKGNVRWLSVLANQIKSNATTAQVCAVADFLRKSTTDAAYQY